MGFFDQPDYDYLRRLMADAHKNAKGTEPEFKWLKHPRVNAEFPSNSKEISNESNGAASNRFTVPKHLPPTPQRQAPSGYGSVIQNPHPVSQIPPQTIPKVLDSGLQQEQPEPTEHKSFFQKLKNFIFCSCMSTLCYPLIQTPSLTLCSRFIISHGYHLVVSASCLHAPSISVGFPA